MYKKRKKKTRHLQPATSQEESGQVCEILRVRKRNEFVFFVTQVQTGGYSDAI